jgi:hypothetical protein
MDILLRASPVDCGFIAAPSKIFFVDVQIVWKIATLASLLESLVGLARQVIIY